MGTKGTLTASAPLPISEIEVRPIDVAIFSPNKVWTHIAVSNDQMPDGRGDLPWIVGAPAEDVSGGGLPSPDTPYWCATLPATVDVDLGQSCYVCEVTVEPYTFTRGFSGFKMDAKLVSDDGEETDTEPPAQGTLTPETGMAKDMNGVPLILKFRAKATRALKLYFSANDTTKDNKVYIGHVRVLGKPVWARAAAESVSVPPEILDKLEKAPASLAVFTADTAKGRVLASEDRHPIGRMDFPILAPGEAQAGKDEFGPYWCAARPAWYEIDLGTGWTTNGGYIQDSAVLAAEANLSGGLTLLARAAAAPVRVYAGGYTDNKKVVTFGSDQDTTFTGNVTTQGGQMTAGVDSTTRGIVTAWDGTGGNAPGCVKLCSPNGTAWYLFIEDDGTLKVHSALPTQNNDGAIVGLQY